MNKFLRWVSRNENRKPCLIEFSKISVEDYRNKKESMSEDGVIGRVEIPIVTMFYLFKWSHNWVCLKA